MRRIAVLTSGGDAPGMNAAIRAIIRTAVEAGFEAFGVRDGFEGLMDGRFVDTTGPDRVDTTPDEAATIAILAHHFGIHARVADGRWERVPDPVA